MQFVSHKEMESERTRAYLRNPGSPEYKIFPIFNFPGKRCMVAVIKKNGRQKVVLVSPVCVQQWQG